MCSHGVFSQTAATNCLFYNIVDSFTFLGPLNLFLYKKLFVLPIECESQGSYHGYILWYVVANVGYIFQLYFKPKLYQICTAPYKPIAELWLFIYGWQILHPILSKFERIN